MPAQTPSLPPHRPTIVIALSRKGGVGKTSILLSAAIQLAARGRRVAYLELDTQGAHLSQFLPTDRDMDLPPFLRGREYRFNPMPFERAARHGAGRFRVPDYRRRACITWSLSSRRRELPDMEEMLARVAINSAAKDLAQKQNRGPELEAVERNLGLLLSSGYLRDLSTLTNLEQSADNEAYLKLFADMIADVLKAGYEYVFVDNAPGVGFVTANNLSWAIGENRRGRIDFFPWFIGSANWWEQGLLFYETNPYAHLLSKAHPTFVVNRALNNWLGFAEFPPGMQVVLDGSVRDSVLMDLVMEVSSMPIWIAAPPGIFETVQLERTIPRYYAIAVLGDDEEVRDSMLREQDEVNGRGTRGASLGDVRQVVDYQIARFSKLAAKFIQQFLLPALGVKIENRTAPVRRGSFHEHVRSALVEPLLARGDCTTAEEVIAAAGVE